MLPLHFRASHKYRGIRYLKDPHTFEDTGIGIGMLRATMKREQGHERQMFPIATLVPLFPRTKDG